MYPSLKIGNFEIALYSLTIILGITVGIIYFYCFMKKHQIRINYFYFLYFLTLVLIFFIFGAALWDFIAHYINGDDRSGISILGGVVIDVPALYLLSLFFYGDKKVSRILLNGLVPLLVIGQSFGRLGCFFGGCCFGKPTNSVFGVVYPEGSIPAMTYGFGTKLIPTQLIEAGFMFIFFWILVLFIKERRWIAYSYVYGIYRFFAEFMRGDNRGKILPFLSPAQVLSIVLVISATIILIVQRIKKDDGKMDLEIKDIKAIFQRKKKNEVL